MDIMMLAAASVFAHSVEARSSPFAGLPRQLKEIILLSGGDGWESVMVNCMQHPYVRHAAEAEERHREAQINYLGMCRPGYIPRYVPFDQSRKVADAVHWSEGWLNALELGYGPAWGELLFDETNTGSECPVGLHLDGPVRREWRHCTRAWQLCQAQGVHSRQQLLAHTRRLCEANLKSDSQDLAAWKALYEAGGGMVCGVRYSAGKCYRMYHDLLQAYQEQRYGSLSRAGESSTQCLLRLRASTYRKHRWL